jgi:hypothetical protein
MSGAAEFKMPNFSRDFFWVAEILKFKGFCHALQKANKHVVDHPTVEAAWLLKTKFQVWEGGRRLDNSVKQAMLVGAILQVTLP